MNDKKKANTVPSDLPADSAHAEMADNIARALRDAIYGKSMDAAGWDIARPNWVRDATAFLTKLEALGYVVVKGRIITDKATQEKTFLPG